MPEESEQPKTLHELVSGKVDEKNKNKKVVGYSVSSYAGVLSALEKARQIQNGTTGQTTDSNGLTYGNGSNVSIISRSWTFLSNYGISDGVEIENEFFKTDLNQARVVLRDYMPFVLDCKNDKGQIERTCVGREDYKAWKLLHQGMTVRSSQNPQFPPGLWSEDAVERCKNGLATESGSGFSIGLGVAFNQLVINYFKHFYPNMPWDEEKLKTLAARGFLCGELMIPKGENAKVLHSKITVDISQSNSSAYDVFVPVPLMLIDDFKEIGYVKVRNNKVEEDVDWDKLKFPFSDKKFNHKKCEIEGFTPDAVKDYVPGSKDRHVEYRYTGLNGGKEVQGRIRLYFMKEGEGDVSSVVGAIPDEYKGKLFSGVVDEKNYYKTEDIKIYDTPNFQSGDIYWDPTYFAGTSITREQYEKCVRITWDFEVNDPSGDWDRCEDIGDTAGISYGPFQYTEASGLLTQVVTNYLEMKKNNYNEYDEILRKTDLNSGDKGTEDGKETKVTKGYKGTKYADNTSVKQALMAVGSSQEMKNVQGKMFLDKRIRTAVRCMNQTGMKSALALHLWAYYINHGWSTSYLTKAKNGGNDEASKCLALVNAHETRLRNLPAKNLYYKGKYQIVKPWIAYPGWQPMIASHKKAVNDGNFNLDKPQKWRDHTV